MNVMNKKTVEDIDVSGKKVLVRCDFNVPIKDGVISDDKRIKGAMPTIEYLYKHGAKVILCSHMGRPKGEFKMEYSLAPVAKRLSELLGKEVIMAKDVICEDAKAKATLCFLKTYASIKKKPKTTHPSPKHWPIWLKSLLTTHLVQPTAPIAPPPALRITCPLFAAT